MSGHEWNDDRCELCGDKDWMADKFCAGNPVVAEQRVAWLEQVRLEHQDSVTACAKVGE